MLFQNALLCRNDRVSIELTSYVIAKQRSFDEAGTRNFEQAVCFKADRDSLRMFRKSKRAFQDN